MRRFFKWIVGERRARLPRRRFSPGSARSRDGARFESLESRTLMAADVTPTFSVTNDWTSGFQAELRLDNQASTGFSGWRLEFDLNANITSLWNGKIESRVGNHYTIVGAAWNETIAPGGSVSFGFVASASAGAVGPANYVLNGSPLGGDAPKASVSVDDVALIEGQSGATSALFTVKLAAAATNPVTVHYVTTDGTALAGGDYASKSGTLTFSAGETSKSVSIPIVGDTAFELDESFYLDLSGPTNATLSKARGTGTIKNDDAPPTTGNFQFKVTSDWGSGFTGDLTIRNAAGSPANNWRLEFDLAAKITSIWNAKIVSQSGNHYVVEHAGYNDTIAVGGTVSFGFVATPGNVGAGPTNFVLRSDAAGGPGPTNQAPVANADAAFTLVGQSTVINLLGNDHDPDGDALSIAALGAAAHGTVALRADQTVGYTPSSGFVGVDSFTYQLRDASGATATGTVRVTVAQQTDEPAQMFAPYVDMTLYPMYDLVSAAQTQGLRHFTLAFVVADPNGHPAWGGYGEYALGSPFDAQMRNQMAGVRALGGDVIVSFGGAANHELAQVITDVATLTDAYQAVIDAYGLTHIDFDVEGAAAADRVSIDRRNQAIAELQRDASSAGRTLVVSYTLPVLPSGLTHDGMYVVQSAVQFGVDLGIVNVMAMDYGDSAAPNPQGRMGDYAIEVANSLFAQLKSVYGGAKTDAEAWRMVGVTPMIGLNDVTTEIFDQQEAREVMAFAQQQGIGRLSFWSLNRDRQHAAGQIAWVDIVSSSVLQQPFEFSQIFRPFGA